MPLPTNTRLSDYLSCKGKEERVIKFVCSPSPISKWYSVIQVEPALRPWFCYYKQWHVRLCSCLYSLELFFALTFIYSQPSCKKRCGPMQNEQGEKMNPNLCFIDLVNFLIVHALESLWNCKQFSAWRCTVCLIYSFSCGESLEINKMLIREEQLDYQREMERKY